MITLPKKLLIGAIFSSMVLYLLVIIHPHQATAASCHSVHIFSARGYEEPYDATMNRLDFFVVPAVCKGRSSCGYEDVIYPALFPDSEDEYCRTSEMEGVINAEAQIKDYAYRCPRSKIVLVGYNQGAQIMGDVLSGGGGLSCNASNVPLDPATVPGNMISAVALFGDPRYTANQPYNLGSAGAQATGAWPRVNTDLSNLNKYEDRLASYCSDGSILCAGGYSLEAGRIEVEVNCRAAAKFINGKL